MPVRNHYDDHAKLAHNKTDTKDADDISTH
jgi:hypothetical protein